MKYNYFSVPAQVKFWDTFNARYIGGIAYRDAQVVAKPAREEDYQMVEQLAVDVNTNLQGFLK